MEMNKKNFFKIVTHTFIWIAIFFVRTVLMVPSGVSREGNSDHFLGRSIPLFIYTYVFCIILFYLNFYVLLPKFFNKGKRSLYFLSLLLFLCLLVLLENMLIFQLFASHFPKQLSGDGRPLRVAILYFIFSWLFSTIFYLFARYEKIEELNKEMEVQKLFAELNYLKLQINPHFFFNTLNNIYSLSLLDSEKTSESILKLSLIMRHVTQESEALTVDLQDELEYIANFIELQELKGNDKLQLKFNVINRSENEVIAPLLLITFVENAFKHGVSNHSHCYVTIHIDVKPGHLEMNIRNSIFYQKKERDKAVGIQNAMRRLSLQYPGKHILKIEETATDYIVNLQIELT